MGAGCATVDGADCCGSLLCVNGKCSNGTSTGPLNFKAPFPCGQTWTYSHHSKEVRRALDFVNTQGGTNGMPVLASEAGTATRMVQSGGAGNYIVITHGGGWKTYYFHLSSYSVPSGAVVKQGQEIGKVGTTGASSGPHIHYEQLLNGAGKDIVFDGKALTPYPGSYSQKSITSTNCQ
ncbi:MAG: M23 family metallopeptidase [Myxococcales bacterium]|nr:MAG: M23 family metallopeptidase [Myxococcales bacterium]